MHTLSPCVCVCVHMSVCVCECITHTLSLSHTHVTHTQTQTHSHTHTHTRERRFCCCMCKILIPLCFNKVSVTVTVTVKIIYADWNYSSTKVKWKDPQRVAGTSCGFVGVLAGSQLCLFAGFLFGVPGFSPKRISFDLLVWCSYTYKSYLLFLVNMILPLKPFPW